VLHRGNRSWARWATARSLSKSTAHTPRRPASVVAASSEGALFDYGSDGAIVENLAALHGLVPTISGSVTRDDEMTRLVLRETTFAVRPLGLPAFTALAARAGWRIDRAIEGRTADLVRLTSS
jgi:hypothetical protein